MVAGWATTATVRAARKRGNEPAAPRNSHGFEPIGPAEPHRARVASPAPWSGHGSSESADAADAGTQWKKCRSPVKYIGHAGGLRRGDDLLVAHRAARLHDRADAGVEQHLQAVGEREEGVGRGDGAGGAVPGPGHGELAGVDPVDLAHADADGCAVAGEQDGVRLHRAARPPGELEVGEGVGVGRLAGGERPGRGHGLAREAVGLLHQQAAGDLLGLRAVRA